jgi:hypothetical protein
MKYELNKKQLDQITKHIQSLIDTSLEQIKDESEDWGLGEMDDLDEIDSINEIKIDRVVPYTGLIVYVNIHTNSNREEFENIMSEINYRVSQILPTVKIFVDSIIKK